MKKQFKFVLVAMTFALLQACGGSDPTPGSVVKLDTSSPNGAFMSVVQSLKNNDIDALMQASMSQADYDKAVKEFETAKKTPSEADKAQFTQTMGMLTGPDAVDQLMAMAGPQLEQARAQLPMMLMMGKGMATQAIQSNTDIPDEQKESITKLANSLMDFVSKNDILSEEVTRKAISAAVQTAKDLNMSSLDELQNMSYQEAMAKASVVMGGAKNIFGAYGISLDDLLSSIEVSDVVENGDSANMQLAYEFLGETFTQTITMLKKDGKWVADK